MCVKTFQVRSILSSRPTRLPVQENIAGFSPSFPSRAREYTLLLQTIESHVAEQPQSSVCPRQYQGNQFSTFFMHLPFKNHPAKVVR